LSFRIIGTVFASLALFFSFFVLFLELGQKVFALRSDEIFWFLFTLLVMIFAIFLLFLKSFSKYYLDRFSSIDNLSKETLHELSTPIATIQANCEVMAKSTTDEKELTRISRISKAANRLMELYEELEWSIKNDSGIQPKTKLMPAGLIEEIIEEFEQKLLKKKLTTKLTLDDDLIEIDYYGLKKSFSNIIDNAIKYSFDKTEIEISWVKKVFYVKNIGEEIKPEEIMNIFDRYYRGESIHQGYGIGLSAVKSFCDKNDISVKINSQNNTTNVELGFSKF
jgi:signal transduction histidine kinase